MMKYIILVILLLSNASAVRNVTATAYSLTGITATGKQVKVGHIALSRDLLKTIPYGSLVRVKPTNADSPNCNGYRTSILIVEDTMAKNKHNTVDVRVSGYKQAIQWGRCQAELRVLRYGRGES